MLIWFTIASEPTSGLEGYIQRGIILSRSRANSIRINTKKHVPIRESRGGARIRREEPLVFQFIGSEVYNFVDKTFPLPLLLKEGYSWCRGRSLLLHGISGSRLRPILDTSGGSAGAGRMMLIWFTIASVPASAPERYIPRGII